MQAGGQLAVINKFVLCPPDINTQNVILLISEIHLKTAAYIPVPGEI